MKSHSLPEPVRKRLELFASGLDDRLQAEAHRVPMAMAASDAFDVAYVDSPLFRALMCSIARELAGDGLWVEEFSNGGCEARIIHESVERRFRLKKAVRDAYGHLVVRASSDSLLTYKAREASFFDDPADFPVDTEQWVLAYLLHPGTRTFHEVSAARITGILTAKPPFRLALASVVHIPHVAAPPKDFPKHDDHLEIPDEEEDEGDDKETG